VSDVTHFLYLIHVYVQRRIVPEYERARQGLEHLERTKSDNADNMHDAGEFEDDPDGDELLEDNDQDFDVADDFGMV
jgi:hypothetical protein